MDSNSTLSNSSNMIDGSHFNNVGRDLASVVVNIHNTASSPQESSNQEVTASRPSNLWAYIPLHGILNMLRSNPQRATTVPDDGQGQNSSTTVTETENSGPPLGPETTMLDLLGKNDIKTLSTTVDSSICTVSPLNSQALDSPSEIYTRLMLTHKSGYPLYKPEPGRGLAKEYRKTGIRIGDVGAVTPDGAFDFLFNTCLPHDDPVNPPELPDNFEVLHLPPTDIAIDEELEPESFLLSDHVNQTSDSPVTHQCSGSEGAVLALPEGSTLYDAQNLSIFQKHAARHAENWYKYMRDVRNRDNSNGSLYLITGCMKTRGWGIATFYGSSTHGNHLQFITETVPDLNVQPTYRWKKFGKVKARVGPKSKDVVLGADEEPNQCAFLRGYKIMLRHDVWEKVTSTVAVPSKDTGSSLPRDAETGGMANGDSASNGMASNRHQNTTKSERVILEGDFNTPSLMHPSDIVNALLLKIEPHAKIALSHDVEWCETFPDQVFLGSRSIPDVEHMLHNITNSYVGVIDEFDCISLVRSGSHLPDISSEPSRKITDEPCNVEKHNNMSSMRREVVTTEQLSRTNDVDEHVEMKSSVLTEIEHDHSSRFTTNVIPDAHEEKRLVEDVKTEQPGYNQGRLETTMEGKWFHPFWVDASIESSSVACFEPLPHSMGPKNKGKSRSQGLELDVGRSYKPPPYPVNVIDISASQKGLMKIPPSDWPPAKKTGAGGKWTPSWVYSQGLQQTGLLVSSLVKEIPFWDDEEGYYITRPNDMLNESYRTVRLLRRGTHSSVVEAVETMTNRRVAVKIFRAIPVWGCLDASKNEVRVLQKLREEDPGNISQCIQLLNHFEHYDHVFLVFDLLGMSLHDFLKENNFAPFPRHQVQAFARQLLNSVAFLHDINLIHTDLRPENILLVCDNYMAQSQMNWKRSRKQFLLLTNIRIIGFESAIFEQDQHPPVVSARFYRAPEVILGLEWSYPCDAYSLGCILVELFTGEVLYRTCYSLEHLAMMEAVMGQMPHGFAHAAAKSKPEFFATGGTILAWPNSKTTFESRRSVRRMRPLQDIILPLEPDGKELLDLVWKLLAFDPALRIRVQESLAHPYLSTFIADVAAETQMDPSIPH